MEEARNNNVVAKQQKPKRLLYVALITMTVGAGTLGLLLKKEADKLGSAVRELQAQTEIVNNNAQVIRDAKLEPSFRSVMQSRANESCTGSTAVLFNIVTSEEKANNQLKKYFAVGQYFCNIGNKAQDSYIRFIAFQSNSEAKKWDFTYDSGGSKDTASSLPGYIYNTNPALYKRTYNNPKVF